MKRSYRNERTVTTRRLDRGSKGANGMTRATLGMLAVLMVGGGVTRATDLSLTVQAQGFESSTISIGPGCDVDYRVTAELDDAQNQGLAAFAFDLDFSGGGLAPGIAPTDPPMTAFVPPDGLSNPASYGGTPEGGRLLQVGGSQNVVMHGQWSCETDDDCPGPSSCDAGMCTDIAGLPLGVVVPDLGYPGSPVTLLTGSLVTPSTPGVYRLAIADNSASVLELGATGRYFWSTEAAGSGTHIDLSINVAYGVSCSPTVGACCLPGGPCVTALPDDCIYVLGGFTNGSGTFCEGDTDGDGTDGECGDLCPEDPLKLDPGICGCGHEDDDTDSDGDTVPDCVDQCPGQDDTIDLNGNGIPDCVEQQTVIPTASNSGLAVFVILLGLSAALLLKRRHS